MACDHIDKRTLEHLTHSLSADSMLFVLSKSDDDKHSHNMYIRQKKNIAYIGKSGRKCYAKFKNRLTHLKCSNHTFRGGLDPRIYLR